MKKLWLILLAVTLCLTMVYGKAQAQPVTVATGTMGDVLLFPLYDVRDTAERTDGWQNYFVIENTTGLWTAVHLRFRAWRKSIEVYDHIILLSPFDVFWAVIEQDATGNVEIWSDDTQTCLNSGLIWAPDTHWSTTFQTFLLEDCGYTAAYLGALADPSTLQEEMQAGSVEIIGLFQLDDPLVTLAEDTHNLAEVVADVYNDGHAGTINVYDVINALFYDYNTAAAPGPNGVPFLPDWPAAIQDGSNLVTILGPGVAPFTELPPLGVQRWGLDCPNVLAAAMLMGDATTGRYEMANFLALEDFRTPNWPGLVLPAIAGGIAKRDAYPFGAILFDTDQMFWLTWNAAGPAPYVNENWATTVGPGLRDGDDIDPIAGMGNEGFLWVPWAANDSWSLDDVENALWKVNMWYHYFDGAYGANYTTDVVIEFPTKHYHYFFRDFNHWNWDGCAGAAFGTIQAYWENLLDYRGGLSYAGYNFLVDWAVDECIGKNPTGMSIADWFVAGYANGPINAGTFVWDMDQNSPQPAPGEPPPGSPWHPVWIAAQPIPHEVNIVRLGMAAGTGTGINEAYGILDLPPTYTMGQFNISNPVLANGDRFWAPHAWWNAFPYILPPNGVVIHQLQYAVGAARSTMSPWHHD